MDNPMSDTNIKRYTVAEPWKEYSVTLEVDHGILTPERASEINSFWSEHQFRLIAEDGDAVRTVIRLAGATLINIMLCEGGADFTENTRGPIFDDNPAPYWSKDLHDLEGWGGSVAGNPFGWCGIRCIAAAVDTGDFHDMELKEVAHG